MPGRQPHPPHVQPRPPQRGAGRRNEVRHAYLEGGQWHDSHGAPLALPLGLADRTLVYDGAQTNAWTYEVAVRGGVPLIAFTAYVEDASKKTVAQVRYLLAEYAGGAWRHREVGTMGGSGVYPGERHYSAGITPLGPDDVVIARRLGERYALVRVYTLDGWATRGTEILRTSREKIMRPIYLPDARLLTYLDGPYRSFTDYDQEVKFVEV